MNLKSKNFIEYTYKLMKITVFQIIVVVIFSGVGYAEDTFAQNILNKTLSLDLRNTPLNDVIHTLQKEIGVKFVYSDDFIKSDQVITYKVTNQKLSLVLKHIFEPLHINYEVIGGQILLKRVFSETKKLDALPYQKEGDLTNIHGRNIGSLGSSRRDIVVTGIVKSDSEEVLPGVSIVLKGTAIGTTTDGEGKYSLSLANGEGILIFSYIGFVAKEVPINNQTEINITLTTDVAALQEVVVVGYGKQKKVNLTGSVATISREEMVKRPSHNVGNLLQGKVAGMQVIQGSGEPGNDNPRLRIRGFGTFSGAGSDPLVLINGVQGNLATLDPQNIESISVLKDAASASIYGARAANGVVLITTKQGKAGELNIEYNGNYQIQQPTRLPKFVTNSADFMSSWNYANQRAGLSNYFSEEEINDFRTSTDRVKYPNFNWMDHMISNGAEQNHNISINGGSEKTKFNVSLGYIDQKGINDAFTYSRINMMFDINSKLNKIITFGSNVSLNHNKRVQPIMGSSEFMLLVYTAGPNYMPKLSDGSGRWTWRYNNAAWHNRNPEQALSYGDIRYNNYSLSTQAYVDITLAKDLVFGVKGAINYDGSFDKQHEVKVPSYFYSNNSLAAQVTGYRPGVMNQFSQNILSTLYSTLNYSKSFNNHHFNVLLGYSQESNNFRYLQGYREKFPTDNLSELNAGATDNQSLNGSSNAWALQSLFGRLNYDFKGKYLLEANLRYDGSSRIYKDQRWGVFPSLSAGWRLSEEGFMKSLSWMSELKLRASWGKLGNQNIGLYPYQDIMSINGYAFGSTVEQGASVTRLTDKTLKWETTSVTDLGIDLNISNGLFSMTADWFDKVTDDILYGIEIPASIGLSSPTVNFAKMKNSGFEFQVGHANKIRDLKYSVNFNFSAIENEVLKVKAPTYGQTTIQAGLPWNSYYLTEWIGIFQSQEEIDSSPKHPYNPKPGDLKFKDQNNDGVINSEDRIVFDGAFPKFYYGGSINIGWKNFDLSGFFQGVQGQKFYVNGWGIDPFIQGSAPTEDFASKAWTPENPTNKYPAMYTNGYGPVTGTPSTYYLKDASYLRLKNLSIGYSLPAALSQKLRLKNLRIYISGDNLVTITKYPAADPERLNSGQFQSYPQLKAYTVGLNVKF